MTTAEKSSQKQKQAIHAELNFVAQHPIERIAADIEALASRTRQTDMLWLDADTALFSLSMHKEGRTTAVLYGRLQRWAGTMTHVYCDGKAKTALGIGARLAILYRMMLYSLPVFTLVFLFTLLIDSPAYLLLWMVLFTLVIAILRSVTWALMYWLQLGHERRSSTIAPEARDRERLMDLLVDIIRDKEPHPRLSEDTPDAVPLTEEELASLLQHASLQRN